MALNAARDQDGLDVFCEVCRSRSSCRKTWDLFGAFLLNRGGASRGLSQEACETYRDYTPRNSCHCRVQMHGLLLRAAESSKHSAGHSNCDMPKGELQAQSEGELDPSFLRQRESGDWTVLKRQEAASSLRSPSGASDCSPGRHRRQEPLVPPWVSVSAIFSLSPNTCFVVGG